LQLWVFVSFHVFLAFFFHVRPLHQVVVGANASTRIWVAPQAWREVSGRRLRYGDPELRRKNRPVKLYGLLFINRCFSRLSRFQDAVLDPLLALVAVFESELRGLVL
jgi:hypothetical protein